MEGKLRKERIWSLVSPVDPAAIMPRTTLIDAGEKMTLEFLETVEITFLARLRETWFCSEIDSRTSIFAGRGSDWSINLLAKNLEDD